LVEDFFGVGHPDWVALVEIEFHVGFAEGHVVGVRKAVVDELPGEAF